MAKTKANAPELKFYQKLVLNRYILSQFGVEDLPELSYGLKLPKYEAIDKDGNTGFYKELYRKLGDKILLEQNKLQQYDINIVSALEKINYKRTEKIRLKYFQYLSLLFAEYYLDMYFNDSDKLLNGLNDFVKCFNEQYPNDTIKPYIKSDLNKIALWNATGSGKTLLMHINYHQYNSYAKEKSKDGSFILLTPKEGLSSQHLTDYELSNIKAKVYVKDESMMFADKNSINVIENTKLGEKDGQKTVAVSRFGNNNVVFVDEGHRGASGDTWYKFRNEICKDGFSFEYSATFGQAVKASNDKSLINEYAKCILFDYSYKYFYNDGYGKDYNIINLTDDSDKRLKDTYLTACLLTYYQQKRLFLDSRKIFASFNIENPLFVFVGAKVNAVRSENGSKVSDVVDIMLFFKDFVSNPAKFVEIINKIKSGKTGIIDNNSRDIFYNAFTYLSEIDYSADKIYYDVLDCVFNCKTKSAILHVENLKGIDGEIRLRLGENDAFGVINVGDDSELLKLFEANDFETASADFSESLFDGITKPNSTINLLVGSKKFTEGWNCWRVSTMGLMNVGRSEGSEIIQLFGRGVRLKGYEMCLKRTSALIKDRRDINIPSGINILETLNIFGLRADYMKQFKDYLEAEGVSSDKQKPYIIKLPTIKNNNYKKSKLVTLKLKDDVDFKKDAPKPSLKEISVIETVILDCYGKVQFETSKRRNSDAITKEEGYLKREVLALFDYDAIYFELVRYKNEKARHNFNINKTDLITLLNKNTWYKLLIPSVDLEMKNFSDLKRFEKIAIAILKEYCDKFYIYQKKKWETPLLTYELLDHNESKQHNFVDEYEIVFDCEEDNKEVINFIERLKSNIEEAKSKRQILELKDCVKNDFEFMGYKEMLYSPLVYLSKRATKIEVSPIALNESESVFIKDLRDYLIANKEKLQKQEIYLIRNKSRKGIGFFEDGGFYPDFIMWIVAGSKQRITFIDPHGMRQEDFDGGKVNLYKSIKQIEKEQNNPNIILNSIILSPTKYNDMPLKSISKQLWNDKNVFFMEDEYIEQLMNCVAK